MYKTSFSRRLFEVFNALALIAVVLVMFYPMWYVVCASLSDSNLLMQHRGLLLKPVGFSLSSYALMIKNKMLIQGLMNTLYVLVFGTIINIIMTSICAYILSRRNFYWSGLMSKLIIFTMYFGGGLIPEYLLVNNTLHLGNSLLSLMLPGAISVYNMLIMRTSFMGIPTSLEESAKIDGAEHWDILFKIVIPLSKAIIAVMVLYYGVAHWNSWFQASIYIKDRSKYPLQLFLREILISNDTTSMSSGADAANEQGVGETIKYAVIVFSTFPILCVYPYLQKYFVKGIMIGAVKG